MQSIAMKTKLSITLALLLVSGVAAAQDLGTSGGYDLDALWSAAQTAHDLEQEDAVILVESRQVTLAEDGTIATRVHRVVWIGSSQGIRGYADLRVPWNSGTSDLEVEILRTWMDGRWWPDAERISETAVVHTLPYALREAYDYADMRETMLLHDGVELPCIMETAYTITERGQPAADGVFVFPQRDPAMLVELTIQARAGESVNFVSANGAPQPTEFADSGKTTWRLADVPALALPLTPAPAAYEPVVAWSTWTSHDAMISTWREAFDNAAAAVVVADIIVPLHEHTLPVSGNMAKLRAMADFVDESVRTTHYRQDYWRLSPRPADRIWNSAYGHVLDKAVLVTGILRELGYLVEPVFVSHGANLALVSVPGLSGLGDLMLTVRQRDLPTDPLLVYDPAHGTVHGENHLSGQTLVMMKSPFETNVIHLEVSLFSALISLQPGDEGAWAGTGHVEAGGQMAFSDLAPGSGTAIADRVAAIGAGLLPDATIDKVGVQVLVKDHVGAEFEVAVPAPETDEIRWVVGTPQGGLLAALPHDVSLVQATRESPVLVGSRLQQGLLVTIEVSDHEVVHLPQPLHITNEVGEFQVTAEIKDGWLQYQRLLMLEPGVHAAAQWPALRELLLAEADPANGTIVIKPVADGM